MNTPRKLQFEDEVNEEEEIISACAIIEVDQAGVMIEEWDCALIMEEGNEDEKYKDPTKYRGLFDVPGTFQEAYNNENEWERIRWREAIGKVFHKMITHGVWRKMKRDQMKENRRCIKIKWVFDIK